MPRTMVHHCLVVILLLLVSWAQAAKLPKPPPSDRYPADVPIAWFDLLYDVVKHEKITPPPASRIYGIAAVALYEAIAPGSSENRSLVQQLNELEFVPQPKRVRAYHWPTVANSALAHAAQSLFSTASQDSLEAIDALEQTFAAQFESIVPPFVYRPSVAYGQAVAGAILAWAATDGSPSLNNCPYTPPVGPGLWEPTPPAFTPNPLEPCWGQLRPFLLRSGDECAPPTHPPYSQDPASDFYAAASQVYTTSLVLTEDQETIALYWADTPGTTGTPSGHWIAIMAQIARNDNLSLMAAAEGFARVGIAVADAFIGCWRVKYTYNLLRPVTYIQDFIDAIWLPLITTPNFPEYTSGHSTQSAAVSALLTAMFGIKPFTDTLHRDHDLEPNLPPRSFTSFDEAAEEAATSRFYGGIHFLFGIDNGLLQGRCIGQVILDRIQFKR
jgi:hypothetical protein